ncbi:MAG: C_GCAxxG_C_C family protein [Armatimonadetes bacterium]|nr:C_GCAxxG_C_C family protein [Armatimonadota bacterium]
MGSVMGEKAQAAFATGMSCSQAVAMTYAGRVGADADLLARAAIGFGAGMGRRGETCGAVTGAYLILGLALGKQTDGAWNKGDVYDKVHEFTQCFAQRCGAVDCRDLLGYDISDPEQMAKARELGLVRTVCPNAVGAAAEILEQMLNEQE